MRKIQIRLGQQYVRVAKSERIRFLINAGPDPTEKNSSGESIIKLLASCEDSTILKYVLESLENSDMTLSLSKSEHLKEATLVAINSQCIKSLEVLLGHGADVNSVYRNGTTNLMLAMLHPGNATAMLLVECGAEIDAVNSQGETALHLALIFDHIENARYLIEKGAKLDIQDLRGESVLQIARGQGYHELVALIEASDKTKNRISDVIAKV